MVVMRPKYELSRGQRWAAQRVEIKNMEHVFGIYERV